MLIWNLLIVSSGFDYFLFLKGKMMKIDFGGLDPSAPLKGNTDDLHNEILAAPSFKLPITADVSLTLFYFCFLIYILCPSQWLHFLIFPSVVLV